MAIWGDEGIHQKMGQGFWEKEVAKILADFKREHFVDGICNMIQAVGEALKENFPYASDDKNELDDTIVYYPSCFLFQFLHKLKRNFLQNRALLDWWWITPTP